MESEKENHPKKAVASPVRWDGVTVVGEWASGKAILGVDPAKNGSMAPIIFGYYSLAESE